MLKPYESLWFQVSSLLQSSSPQTPWRIPGLFLYTWYLPIRSSIKQSKLLGILPRGWGSFFTIYTLQLLSADFKNTTVCNTLNEWKYLWTGLLYLLSIIYQNNLEKFPFSSIYFHSFCSKPKIHQLMYRLHDANCSHPLAHLDLSLKATWPSASTQSRWGHQAKGSNKLQILPSSSTWLSLLAQLHQPSFERRRVTQFVILSLII